MQQDEKQSRKPKKEDVAVVFDAARGVIQQWDPYSLLASGCPTDEFDAEIQAVARQVDEINSPQNVGSWSACVSGVTSVLLCAIMRARQTRSPSPQLTL